MPGRRSVDPPNGTILSHLKSSCQKSTYRRCGKRCLFFLSATNLRLPNPRGNLRDLAGPHDIHEMQPRRESEQMPHGEEHSARGHGSMRD